MLLHELKLKVRKKRSKRIGRGGKRGSYSGRGQKGQRSRAGHRIRPAYRDLILRLPKLRGAKNKILKPKPLVLNLDDLEKMFDGRAINKNFLRDKGLIKSLKDQVKILGRGNISKPLLIEGLLISAAARKKIESAGGKVI